MDIKTLVDRELAWIRSLSEDIGPRGSTTDGFRRSADFAMAELVGMGAQNIRLEPFYGAASTYRPFVAAFAAALLGSLLALRAGGTGGLVLAAVLNLLGAVAMFSETDLQEHWGRAFGKSLPTANVVADIYPTGEPQKRVVLCAHLDTHRTPVFFSSPGWLRLFTYLVGGTLLSMALGTVVFVMAAILDWGWLGWIGLPLGIVQAFTLMMMVVADRTPYTAGANDNASGVAVALGLAKRLCAEPLQRTAVTILLTDCEETGAHGAMAYLAAHRDELAQAVFIAIDMVGSGVVKYLSADGLLLKHPTHPRALGLARAAAKKLPNVSVIEMTGLAYTDALPFTKAGLAALTLCSVPPGDPAAGTHWHQVSDTITHIERSALMDSTVFAWQVLQEIDQSE